MKNAILSNKSCGTCAPTRCVPPDRIFQPMRGSGNTRLLRPTLWSILFPHQNQFKLQIHVYTCYCINTTLFLDSYFIFFILSNVLQCWLVVVVLHTLEFEKKGGGGKKERKCLFVMVSKAKAIQTKEKLAKSNLTLP